MHLVPNPPSSSTNPRAITLVETDTPNGAANDCGSYSRRRYEVADANVLVARVVGHVAARVQPRNVNIELSLAPGHPLINGDPTQLAFAISGVLGAELRSIDSRDGGTVRVELKADARTVCVVMTSDDLPPLCCVRALGQLGTAHDVDPTVAHCRRIVEAIGGRLELTEQNGRIGFSVAFPRVPLSTNVRVLPQRRPHHAAGVTPLPFAS